MKRPVLGRDDGSSVCPVLVETALVPEQSIDQLRVEGTEAAEHDQQVIAGDDRGRVELQAADRLHQLMDVVRRDWLGARSAQSLAGDRQPPRVLDPDLSAHARTDQVISERETGLEPATMYLEGTRSTS